MTDQRKHPDGIGETDELVSLTYRELADEQVPRRLDERILRQAAKAARPAYAKSISWTKPLAWAATIAICLAITLQVTQVPLPEGTPAIMSVDTPEKDQAEAFRDSELRNVASPSPAAGAAASAASDAPGDAESKRSKQESAPAEATSPLRQRVDRREQADAAFDEVVPAATMEFEAQDLDVLQRAEDMVKLREGPNQAARRVAPEEASASSVSSFASPTAVSSELVAGCDEDAKASPDTWHACIVALEEAGMAEMAERMRKELAEAFPDFEAP